MSASSILSSWVSVQLTKLGARIFRNAVGMAYQGDAQKVKVGKEDAVLIKNFRYLPFGLLTKAIDKKKKNAGSSDKIGWTPVLITADMIGQTIAVFTAVEEKTLAYKKLTDDQKNFLDEVVKAGGLAYVARETKDGPVLNKWPE